MLLKGYKMILRSSDVKVVHTLEGDIYALYVDGTMRTAGLAEDVIRHILHSFDINFQNVTLPESVIDAFDGVLPQKFRELDEVIEDEQNCEL